MATKDKATSRTLKELIETYSDKVDWLWRHHIPRAMPTMLSGREGTGKTGNALTMCKEIAEANPENMVYWIASDGVVEETIIKAARLGLSEIRNFGVIEHPTTKYQWDLRDFHDIGLLKGFFSSSRLPTILLVVDSLRSTTGYNDNDTRTGAALSALAGLVCDEHRSALLFLDHHKKGKADNLLDKVSGTTAKTGVVRLVYSIMPQSDLIRIIAPCKNNLTGINPPRLQSVETDSGIVITEVPDDTKKLHKAQLFLMGLFSRENPIPSGLVEVLYEANGFSYGTITRAKATLNIVSEVHSGEKVWYMRASVTNNQPVADLCPPEPSMSQNDPLSDLNQPE